MDRLESMAVFVKAADLGSFTAAADVLGISAAMVGKHVRALEWRLGARLINRTTRRQSLTELGRGYYERCRAVLAEAETAEALFEGASVEPRGKLKVSMPVHFGRVCVVPVLLELAARHPGLEMDLSLTDRLVDLVEEDCDLAIRTGELEARSGLMTRKAAAQEMIVCASPAYVDAHGAPASVADLGAHKAIVYRRAGRVAPWLFPSEDGSPLEARPSFTISLDDLEAIADTAAAGVGLAWLPSWLVKPRIACGALSPLLNERRGYPYDCHLLWPHTAHLPQKTRLAIDALAKALPRMVT